ncbi:MAG: hypothetical protein LUC22_01385 [Prevotella sp.]|nr:hypothetical protein [Prevotella sp.]
MERYYNRADLMETVAQTIKSAKADGVNILVVEDEPGVFSVEVKGRGICDIPLEALPFVVSFAYVLLDKHHQ